MRFAERMFDRDTVERVMAPALTDLQHECANAGTGVARAAICVRAYWGVLKAIAVCLLRDVVSDRHRAGRRLAGQMLAFLFVLSCLMSIPELRFTMLLKAEFGARTAIEARLLSLPSTILLILPAAMFFTLVFQRERSDTSRPSLIPTMSAAVVACTIAVFALIMFAAPEANQSFRSLVHAAFMKASHEPVRDLPRGLNEMTLPMLNEHIAQPISQRERTLARNHLQRRFAFVALVPIFGLLGLSLVDRWRSRLLTLGAALAIFFLYAMCINLGADRYGNTSLYGPWTANALFFVLAVRLLRTRRAAQHA
jgi:lipopolysaccharide export LptBFGC system permease protein LptF